MRETSSSPYLLRSIAIFANDAKALAAVIKTFGWTYISIIHSDNSDAELKAELLSKELRIRSVCVAVLENIGSERDSHANRVKQQRKALKKLDQAVGSVGVVVIGETRDFRLLIRTIDELGKDL